MGKEILFFSLPLLFVEIMFSVINWTDTLMIGILYNETGVGIYNTAKPLSGFISTGLTVVLFIYTPIAANFYAKEKFKENKRIFVVITKWICFLTLPLTLCFILFPDVLILNTFGEKYLNAVIPLQILPIAFYLNNLMGPNGSTLTVYGKTKFLLYATSFTALLNVLLNLFLIPYYGIIGASLATFFSLIIVNILRSLKLYKIKRIHSFKKELLKPIILTTSIVIIIYFFLKFFIIFNLFLTILFTMFIYFLIFIVTIITNGISKEDIDFLLYIEKFLGFNLKKMKKLLRRFIPKD